MDRTTRSRHSGTSQQTALTWASRSEGRLTEVVVELALEEALFIDAEEAAMSAVAALALERLAEPEQAADEPVSATHFNAHPAMLRSAAQAGIKAVLLRERALGYRADEDSPLRSHEETLVHGFGVGRDRVRAALLAYNGLPATDRHAFFELFVKRTDYSDLIDSTNPDSRWPGPEAFQGSIKRSLAALYSREDKRP